MYPTSQFQAIRIQISNRFDRAVRLLFHTDGEFDPPVISNGHVCQFHGERFVCIFESDKMVAVSFNVLFCFADQLHIAQIEQKAPGLELSLAAGLAYCNSSKTIGSPSTTALN
ncbi:MAG: hypothetical protein CME25_22525 [Gemmatimonadetes bacterium]|nr:hypothetical protein [Gemmatimonadota bacterium]